jgi:periplasmic protein CpxP/Spy
MKLTRPRILAIAAAVMLAAAAVFAQGMHGHGPDGEFGHLLGFYTHALDLTADQQTQIKAIWAKEKPSIKPLMQQERTNHAAMESLLASGPFDEAKTRTLATANAQTLIELEVQHARIKSEMMQVLTADQKTKLTQIEAEHQSRMQSHMKDGAAPPPEE